ncbi:MAG: cellulase family glycosylhydrolase [Bacteroidales bacterium]|nr:cellulase family glycosylhydrolase [Bacteroidales bacterium]
MFVIEKGINLSHWLSQVFGWSPREVFVTEDDIIKIKKFGFDHVRLPIDEEELWDIEGNKLPQAWQCMINCIEWCEKHNLKLVLDMHILRSHHFNAANHEGAMTLWSEPAAQENFLALWTQLSAKLKLYSTDVLAYELMNEPVAPQHDMWNKLLDKLYTHVRALEPKRTLVIGSNMWQTPKTYPHLVIPENDPNIILSIHTYDPLLLTHYKAYWLPIKDFKGSIQYPGIPISEADLNVSADQASSQLKAMVKEHNIFFDRDSLLKIMQPAIDAAKRFKLPLYCSEFGCLPSVPSEMRMQYYKDMISNFKSAKIAHCHWDLKGDFGIINWDRVSYVNKEANIELIEILTK